MSEARLEILKLIAEGKISPDEGDRLLRALGSEGTIPEGEESPSKTWSEGIAQAFQEMADTVRRTVDDAVGATQKMFDEHRPETETVEIIDGGFAIAPGTRLKVQHAIRVSLGGTSKGSHVVIRSGADDRVRIVRGQAVEAHRNGEDYVLTWAKGNLELEVPSSLGELEVRCLGSDLEVQDFPGSMVLETTGGELRVRSPRAPFRFKTLGGRVRIAEMSLAEGAAMISSTGGDVEIDLTPTASLTVRASTLGGKIEFSPGAERDSHGRTRRRSIAVFGEGAGALSIDTLGGDVRVRQEKPTD